MSSRVFPRNKSAVLAGDEHRKIISVDVERDIEVGGMQMRFSWVVERWDLRPCQDDVARPRGAARPALQQVAQMNGAEFILIRASGAIQAHCHQCYLSW